jgi:hypothetical protein
MRLVDAKSEYYESDFILIGKIESCRFLIGKPTIIQFLLVKSDWSTSSRKKTCDNHACI